MTIPTQKARRTKVRSESKALEGAPQNGAADETTAAPGHAAPTISPEVGTPAAAPQGTAEAPRVQVGDMPLPSPTAKVTKVAQLEALLAAPEGATLAGLCSALGWQSHTVRAALTRLRQAGHSIERSQTEDGRTVYRIPASGPSEATVALEGAGA